MGFYKICCILTVTIDPNVVWSTISDVVCTFLILYGISQSLVEKTADFLVVLKHQWRRLELETACLI